MTDRDRFDRPVRLKPEQHHINLTIDEDLAQAMRQIVAGHKNWTQRGLIRHLLALEARRQGYSIAIDRTYATATGEGLTAEAPAPTTPTTPTTRDPSRRRRPAP